MNESKATDFKSVGSLFLPAVNSHSASLLTPDEEVSVAGISSLTRLGYLETLLEDALPRMRGAWVQKGSGYEADFAKAIDADLDKQTFWDMQKYGFKIEVKKGQTGAWFDLTRYSDLLTQSKRWQNIITLFLHYEKDDASVKSVIGVTMTSLTQALRLTPEARDAILRARNLLKPSKDSRLNFQSRLTVDELRKIAGRIPNFIVQTA